MTDGVLWGRDKIGGDGSRYLRWIVQKNWTIKTGVAEGLHGDPEGGKTAAVWGWGREAVVARCWLEVAMCPACNGSCVSHKWLGSHRTSQCRTCFTMMCPAQIVPPSAFAFDQ